MRPALKVGAIVLVCAAPVVFGWMAYKERWIPAKQVNYGELLAPRPVGGPLVAWRGKWVLVTFDPAACRPTCEAKLYIVRQVRRAQGKDAARVERLWLVTDGGTPRADLLAALDGGHVAASSAELERAFPGEPRQHIYLVDPLGNLMMRFPAEPDPSRMIRDLERLLRYSSFG